MRNFFNTDPIQMREKRIGSMLLILSITILVFSYNWITEAITQAYIRPKAEWVDMETWVEEGTISVNRMKIMAQQTGLNVSAIRKMLKQGQGQKLLELQEIYFAPVQVESRNSTPLTISEVRVDEEGRVCAGMPLIDLQEGDILLTKNSRFFGWRNGHAGLVIDSKQGLVLEALMPGTKTCLNSVSNWSDYPSFLVLRVKEKYRGENGEVSKKAAAYAKEHLLQVPYSLFAFTCEEESGMALEGTQCAHVVWFAYKQFGLDLDSDGGWIVTPNDIQNSEFLEVIQSCGY